MNKIELLSPVGDFECLKAAVQNGANSVYLGASLFSARAKATNFGKNELKEAIIYAKSRNVGVHLALNTLIKNDEFDDAVSLAIEAYNLGVDAIIIQDLGLAKYLIKNYPDIPLHASTQMTVHNLDGVKQLEKLGYKRVVLSRELSIDDIKYIRENTNIELEVFVHGALCISYSGQCLLSSMIGGRSGNRGLCAQPCRLKYDLIEKNNEKEITLDKGYLMSPKDTLGIEMLPTLIKLGIDSFKIEGRMKTPYYVATVTNIYRKYIDYITNNIEKDNETLLSNIRRMLNNEKNDVTGLTDKEMLTQVFNRGGFSTGHFKPLENRDLIFKEKPNNMGFYLGTISHINENKGHLTFKLENTLSIGDKVSINNDSYNVSELMIDNKNFETLNKGTICTIGRMKGNLSVGQKIYRIETAKLNKYISPSFKEDKNFKKVKIDGVLNLALNKPIELTITSNDGYYNNLTYTTSSSFVAEEAKSNPITDEKIRAQILKTGNTVFEFNDLKINISDNLFIPNSVLNDIRRNALDGFLNLMLDKNIKNIKKIEDIEFNASSPISFDNVIKNHSLLLNIINNKLDYSKINFDKIDRIYVPLKYFLSDIYKDIINLLLNKSKVFIYMPSVNKNDFLNKIDFDSIINKYNICGFVISHISQIETLKKYSNLEFISNYNLNIYNSYTINELKSLNINTVNVSPELNLLETNNLITNIKVNFETIAYGKLPVMTNNYCYLGSSNKCYLSCSKKCLDTESRYYLKDRMNFLFRILPDNLNTITTIFNAKTLSVKEDIFESSSIRIDILDENILEINNIIDTVTSGSRFEGKEYTNENY